MKYNVYRISPEGISSYNKILRDTKLSLYLVGPLILIFWLSVGLFLFDDLVFRIIMILPPMFLIIYGFFITRLFSRGRLMTTICKLVRLDNEFCYFESLKWFHYNPQTITINYNEMNIRDTAIQILNNEYKGVKIADKNNHNEIILLEKYFQNYEEIIAEIESRVQIKTASA